MEDRIYIAQEAEAYTPQPILPTPAPPISLMPPPQPQYEEEEAEPLPRIIILEAEDYISYKGYAFTVSVGFSSHPLNFHVGQEVDAAVAMETINNIVDMFDLLYELFPGQPAIDYFITTEPNNGLSRHVNYNFYEDPTIGFITYLYFSQNLYYPLPWWLCIGLEHYLQSNEEVSLLTVEELTATLRPQSNAMPFGDAWFIPALAPRNPSGDIGDIGYTLVKSWSQADVLYDMIREAQTDAYRFILSFNEYKNGLLQSSDLPATQVLYRFGDFKVITSQGGYIFIDDDYEWTLARVNSFIRYMDDAIMFIRDYFQITNPYRIPVTLYPFGVINVPDSIAELAYAFGWDAPDVNFVTNDEIILASTSRFGTWAIPHEVAHILLFREFPAYRPPTWMVEGMAVLGEILFRDAFTGTRTYRFNVPTVANIDALARNSSGHILPLHYGEDTFGRDMWTYDEAGSFVLYLYNNFGIETLLAMYKSNNYNQFEIAKEIFGASLDDLLLSWRRFLWPTGEPADWW